MLSATFLLPLSGVVVVSSPLSSKVMTVGPGSLLVLDRLREVMISFALDASSRVVSCGESRGIFFGTLFIPMRTLGGREGSNDPSLVGLRQHSGAS